MIKLFLVFQSLIYFSFAQFEQCSVSMQIPFAGRSVSIKNPGRICKHNIIAPADTTILASCNYNIPDTTSRCSRNYLILSRSGDNQLRDGEFFCGRGSFIHRSIGNEISVGLIQNAATLASFDCTFQSVASSNSNCDCGWNVRSRIVGGTNTGVNQFVSHAGLVDQPTKDVFCGATIVSQFWSVSAAHCFEAFPNIRTTALLAGDHDLSTGSDTIWAALYIIETYIKHRNFNPETNANDIALIKTRDYIKFNRGVGPACLPYTFMQNDPYFDGKFLTAVGWGTTEFGGSSSKILKKASVQVVDIKTCSIKNQFIDRTKVCTNEVWNGSCQKDSGGALYFPSGRQYFIGIISYGYYCQSKIPAVNTRVTSYVGWIEENTRGFFCRKT